MKNIFLTICLLIACSINAQETKPQYADFEVLTPFKHHFYKNMIDNSIKGYDKKGNLKLNKELTINKDDVKSSFALKEFSYGDSYGPEEALLHVVTKDNKSTYYFLKGNKIKYELKFSLEAEYKDPKPYTGSEKLHSVGLYKIDYNYLVSSTNESILYKTESPYGSVKYPYPIYMYEDIYVGIYNRNNMQFGNSWMQKYFHFSTKDKSGVYMGRFTHDLKLVFSVDYETMISFGKFRGKDPNAPDSFIVMFKDLNGIDQEVYLDKEYKIIPKPQSQIIKFDNCVAINDGFGFQIYSKDEKTKLDSTRYYFNVGKDIDRPNTLVGEIPYNYKDFPTYDLLNLDGTIKSKDIQSQNIGTYGQSTIQSIRESHVRLMAVNDNIDKALKYGSSNTASAEDKLKAEFDANCLGKGSTCSNCKGTGREVELTYLKRKVEYDTEWSAKEKRMVKVKKTTLTDTPITSKCKSCNSSGNCSTNPEGKYTSVINQYYPGMCIK